MGQVHEGVVGYCTPVSEAVLRLEVEGLVRLYPKKGAMIVPVSAQEAQDVVEARAVIEQWAASRMWPHRKEVLGDLGELLALIRATRKVGAVEDFVAADRTFHERIVAAAGNAILTRHYHSLGERQLCISHHHMRGLDARWDQARSPH